MKVVTILITIFFLGHISYGQNGKADPYSIGFTYLRQSDSVRERIFSIMGKSDFDESRSNSNLLFLCPNIQFINLSEYREQLIPYIDVLGLDEKELNDRLLFRKKHFFESYQDAGLNKLNQGRKHYSAYTAFSQVVGKVLPLIIFVNEYKDKQNPCNQLRSIKFGKALIVILAFNDAFDCVERAFFEEVSLN
jgi:hypothetical protein